MELAFRGREECVHRPGPSLLVPAYIKVSMLVTDMLLAMLNCCSKEELEESSDEETEVVVSPPPTHSEDSHERRKVIKNKILAVGRMSRVFALLRSAVVFLVHPSLAHVVDYPVRSPRRCQSSRVFLAQASCHMAHWLLVRKASRMLSLDLRMRMFELLCTQGANLRRLL